MESAESESLRLSREIIDAARLIEKCFITGGKLLICGNGGSAADASHMAGELVKSFERPKPVGADLAAELCHVGGSIGEGLSCALQRGLPAISLASDGAVMSAIANDLGSDFVFAQQVVALGNPEDLLFCISTSGKSVNIINAAITGRAIGMTVIGLMGDRDCPLASHCDFVIPAGDLPTASAQEKHQRIYHEICRLVEKSRL